jgi:hypothetical protein
MGKLPFPHQPWNTVNALKSLKGAVVKVEGPMGHVFPALYMRPCVTGGWTQKTLV